MSARGRLRMGVPALLAAALLSASLLGCSGGENITVRATFDDVGDLVLGHAVQIADVRVGTINGIELTDDFKAEVTMSIDGTLRIPADSTALLRTTSLLGEKFIELRSDDEDSEGPFLEDGDVLDRTGEAPELEFVTEEAVNVLGGVVSTDMATLIETGAVGFGERGPEIHALIGDLATITGTLAERTTTITSIIDSLGGAATTLAAGTADLDALLLNLVDTTAVLVDNRDRALIALEELSRLARIQSEVVFDPYMADVQRQLQQVDAIVREVVGATAEVENLLTWLERFTVAVPKGIPGDYAQVYGWFVPESQDERGPQHS